MAVPSGFVMINAIKELAAELTQTKERLAVLEGKVK